ncbi:MAG: uroporphyrinogen-III synthase [Alphaproteobacteria bacterium]|nr:uroporphyrinogen-III synthase [Alphaproteobacteria bacterium]
MEAAGHSAVLSPLMIISFMPVNDLGPGGVQAIVVTSRNAVRALAQSPVLQSLVELPVFAVGKGTARDAHELGFHGVMEGPGNAAGLVDVITANASPAGGRLVHFAGYKLAFDLEGALRTHGFEIFTVRCYEAQAAEKLSDEALADIAKGHLDAVLLMSPEASRTYVRLIEAAGIAKEAEKIACVCISQATADALAPFKPAQVKVSSRPNSEEVLALINRMAEQFGL